MDNQIELDKKPKNQHAVALGALGCRAGGLAKSEAKAISSRANGKLGGRPKKKQA